MGLDHGIHPYFGPSIFVTLFLTNAEQTCCEELGAEPLDDVPSPGGRLSLSLIYLVSH